MSVVQYNVHLISQLMIKIQKTLKMKKSLLSYNFHKVLQYLLCHFFLQRLFIDFSIVEFDSLSVHTGEEIYLALSLFDDKRQDSRGVYKQFFVL